VTSGGDKQEGRGEKKTQSLSWEKAIPGEGGRGGRDQRHVTGQTHNTGLGRETRERTLGKMGNSPDAGKRAPKGKTEMI